MSIAKQLAQVEWWFCLKSTAAKKNCAEGLGSRLLIPSTDFSIRMVVGWLTL